MKGVTVVNTGSDKAVDKDRIGVFSERRVEEDGNKIEISRQGNVIDRTWREGEIDCEWKNYQLWIM